MKRRTMFFCFLLSLALSLGLLPASALAKRGPPPEAAPVVADGVRYQAAHDRYMVNNVPTGLREYVEAWDVKANKLLWKVKVYEIVYDQNLETDVQDIYIKSLKMDGKILVATTERKKVYRVDIERHEVQGGQKNKAEGKENDGMEIDGPASGP